MDESLYQGSRPFNHDPASCEGGWRLRTRQQYYRTEYKSATKRRWSAYFVSLLTGLESVPEVKLLGLAPLIIEYKVLRVGCCITVCSASPKFAGAQFGGSVFVTPQEPRARC
jgi:hypothetical protein